MPTRQTVTRRDVELVHWTWPGAEPTTLLLHGIGNYGRYWDLFAEAVGGRLALIAPDARGHGESARPASGYAPEDFVADAIAVLDARGIDRAVVVGHSMGGLHSIQLASRRLLTGRPERFASQAEARAYFERTSPGYVDAVYRNRLEWALREDKGGLVWRSDQRALEQVMSGRDAPANRWAALGAITCQTLVVRGTRSNVLSAEVARRMVASLPHGSLLELEAGHNVPLDQPRQLADAVSAIARSKAVEHF